MLCKESILPHWPAIQAKALCLSLIYNPGRLESDDDDRPSVFANK